MSKSLGLATKSEKKKYSTEELSIECLKPSTIIPADPWVHSFWPCVTNHRNQKQRLIFVMRSAERIDRVFGADWLDTEYTHGKLKPTDQNIPGAIRKFLPHTHFDFDPPITAMGKYTSQFVALAMVNRGCAPRRIVCAPALRCVQTAAAMAETLGVRFGIEYGLAEPQSWFASGSNTSLAPSYISEEKLSSLGFPVDTKYLPIITAHALKKRREEVEAVGRERIDFVLRYLGTMEHGNGPLLVVGHALTLAIATDFDSSHRKLKSAEKKEEEDDITSYEGEHGGCKRFPYGAVVSLAIANTTVPHRYRICRNLIPPLTFGRYFCSKPVLD